MKESQRTMSQNDLLLVGLPRNRRDNVPRNKLGDRVKFKEILKTSPEDNLCPCH
jgi:hypothetical protein